MPTTPQTRLRQLQGEIEKLVLTNDPTARVDLKGKDAVAQLARTINLLLDRMAVRKALLGKVAESFQQTFWILNVKTRRVTYLNGVGSLPADTASWVEAAHPKDRSAVAAMVDKQWHGDSGQAEFRVLEARGAIRWMWCRFVPASGSHKRVTRVFGVLEDVTDEKEAEQILMTSRHELLNLHHLVEERQSQKMQSIGELMGGIAHEINTPVQFVGDNMRFLRDALPKLDELLKDATAQDNQNEDLKFFHDELPKALEQAQEGINRVAKIARTMKEFSREQKDQGSKSANLNQALESTLLIARNAMKYVADVETVYGALPLVTCHLGDIQQVFLELLVHAAGTVGEVMSSSKTRGVVRVETRPAGEWVTISISDTGDALSPEAGRELFATSGSADSEKRGLAVAHAIVTEQHGGTLSVSSEPGKGNTFCIRIPVLGKSKAAAFAAGAG